MVYVSDYYYNIKNLLNLTYLDNLIEIIELWQHILKAFSEPNYRTCQWTQAVTYVDSL